MFGLNLKKKEKKNKTADSAVKVKNATAEEKAKEKNETESESSVKFDLPRAVGKSKEKMEKDFYIFQIKEFMAKVGLLILPPVESVSDVEKELYSAKKHCVNEILVTPILSERFSTAPSVAGSSVSVLLDFPFGHGCLKGRICSVKHIKNIVNGNIILTVPISIDGAFLKQRNVYHTEKALKKTENGGVLVDAGIGLESMKKTFRAYADLKFKSFTLCALNLSGEELTSAVKCAMENKGCKDLYVLSDVDTSESLSEITALGVCTVFTPNAVKIAEELEEKFSVTLS